MDGDTSSDETSVAIAAMQEQAQAHAGQAVQTRAHHQFEQPPQQDVVYVPLWSNLQLPQQAHSTVARAAHYLRSDPSAVPENAALMPSKRRGNNVFGGYLAPGDMQTLATYEAYAALFVVTVLHCESDVPRFVAAERAEFEDAAAVDGKRERRFPSRPQCFADSRHLALTLLVQDSAARKDRTLLLDAMAFLAYTGGSSKRAAKEVRFAVLTNEQARTYLETAERGGTKPKSTSAIVLALAYVAEDGGRSATYATIDYCGSATKAFAALVKAVTQAFKQAELAPLLARLPALSSSPEAGELEDAYVKSCLAVNKDFWSRLSSAAEAPKLDYQLRFGKLPWHQTFVKLQPRAVKALDDPEVYFGMLMFREGQDLAKEQYVVNAMQQERHNCNFPADWPVGLRPPVGHECDACPHILSMRADKTSFSKELCAYTTRTAPGMMMTPYDDACMPRLVYSLVPYTEEFKNDHWVFPCTQDQCDELEDLCVDEKWAAAKQGFAKYGRICGLSAYQGTDKSEDPEAVAFKTKKLKGLAGLEDQALVEMVGMPLGSAFRLGEVSDALSRTKQRLPALRSYLKASIERLGTDASMSEALCAAAKAETERAALSAKVAQLERRLVDDVHKDAGQRQLQSAPTCSVTLADMCFKFMNLKGYWGTPTVMPLSAGTVVAIGRVLYAAKQDPPNPKQLRDSQIKPHCKGCTGMNAVSAAAYLAEKMHSMPLHILVRLKDDQGVEFYKSSDRGNGCIVKVLPLEVMEAHATRESSPLLMVKYDVATQKLSALVPQA